MKIVIILSIIAAILTGIVNIFQFDERVFNSEPFMSSLIKDTEIYSYPSLKGSTDEWSSVPIGQALAGSRVNVLENHFSWYKILLNNGTMGWVKETNLQASKGALTKHYNNPLCALFDKPDAREGKVLKRIDKREYLTILEHKNVRQSPTNIVPYSKVKAADGTIGWIKDYHLERIGWKQPRLINRRNWRFSKASFISDWQGRDISDFINKFSEPSAIKMIDKGKIYFFNNIYLYDGTRKEMGLQAKTTDGKIESFDRTGRITKWIGYFPFSETLRSSILMNNFWDIFDLAGHKSYDKYGDAVKKTLFEMSTWVRVLILIVVSATFLALFYLILYLPYFITHKIAYHYSLNRKLANKIILFIAASGAIVLGYFYFVFINVNIGVFNNWFLLHFLFALGMTIGFIGKWRTDLLYKRCAQCRDWSGVSNGSEKIGSIEKTLVTTYSDGHKTTEKGVEEHWIDHRICTNQDCGLTWDVYRTFWSGWSRA